MTVRIDGRSLRIDDVVRVAREHEPVEIDAGSYSAMQRSRAVVEACLRRGVPVYGVNTGFGKFHDVVIGDGDLDLLQRTCHPELLRRSGRAVPRRGRACDAPLKAHALAAGESGVRPLIVEGLVAMLDRGVHPVVPQKGSVGASGDLAPLSHLAWS